MSLTLRTPREAAALLRCSIKTLRGHVARGALKYVQTGLGTKRPRRAFTDDDLQDFIAAQTRKDVPTCPSTATRARHTGTSTSNGAVTAFTALRKQQHGAKPKK